MSEKKKTNESKTEIREPFELVSMNIELFTDKEIIHYRSLDELQREKEIDLIAVILMCKSFMDDSLEKERFDDLELRSHQAIA